MVSLLAETWTWFSVVTFVVICRLISRIIHFRSIKRLQLDDYLVVVLMVFYTTEVITLNIVSNAQTNLFPPGYLSTHVLSPAEIRSRMRGSKFVLVVEQCQIATIWLVKACLLLMYHRLTRHSFRVQNILICVLAVYVAFGFVFMEIFYFAVWCRPFHEYWAVPTTNVQCDTAINHLITNAVFNISSDLALLVIALPMFIRSKLPTRRKIVLCSVFGLGIFVIVAAVINKCYSFTNLFGRQWEEWYIRESSTAVLVANLPFTWTLLRRILGLRPFDVENSQSVSAPSGSEGTAATAAFKARPRKHRFPFLHKRTPSFVDDEANLREVKSSFTASYDTPSSSDAPPSTVVKPEPVRFSSTGGVDEPFYFSEQQRARVNSNQSAASGPPVNWAATHSRWLGKDEQLACAGLEDLDLEEGEAGLSTIPETGAEASSSPRALTKQESPLDNGGRDWAYPDGEHG